MNRQFAITCKDCATPILQAYNVDHANECKVNKFTLQIKNETLHRIDVDEELLLSVNTVCTLPIVNFRLDINGVGNIQALYAPTWIKEGVNLYYSGGFDHMPIVDFLHTLAP
jgi:hypothetical protein